MKLALLLFLSVVLSSQLIGNENFPKELLGGLLAKNKEKSLEAFNLMINHLEKGVTAEEANSIVLFLAENVKEIQSETISDIFYHFKNIDHPLTDAIFFDCLFNNYSKFKRETQVVIFHLTLQYSNHDAEIQFNRFMEAYGQDLLYLSQSLIDLNIENPKNISEKLLKLLSNENIKYSIYQYFLNQLKAENLEPSEIASINQNILHDLNSIVKTFKNRPKEKQKNLILLLNLALLVNTNIDEKISTKIFSLKNEEATLALIEVFFSQKIPVPKPNIKSLLISDLYKFYLFALCEKYQQQPELFDKALTQEDIGRGQLMRWFYEKLQIKVSADKIIFDGMHKIESETPKKLALFKCFIEFPFVKEIIPIAASGGIFKDEKDMSFSERESVGSNFTPWFGQKRAKHVHSLKEGQPFDTDNPLNSSSNSETEKEPTPFQEFLSNITFGQLFFIYVRSLIEDINDIKGAILELEDELFEVIFDDRGRITAKYPVIKKNSKYIREGKFNVILKDLEINVIGQFSKNLLNGEIKIIQNDSSLLFDITIDHNKLKSLQVFDNHKLSGTFTFSDQLFNGPFIIFNETNQKTFECNYIKGKRQGASKDFYDNGTIKKTLDFKNGLPNGDLIKYNEEGKIVLKIELDKNWSGPLFSYYPSGELQQKGFFKNQVLHGPVEQYFLSGKLKATYTFHEALLEGFSLVYYENGTLKGKSKYIKGQRQGEERYFYESGKLRFIVNYLDDLGDGEFIEFSEDGIILSKGELKNNAPYRYSLQNNSKGELIAQCTYEKGEVINGTIYIENSNQILEFKQFKPFKRFTCDENGKIIKEIELFEKKTLSMLKNAIKESDTDFIKKISVMNPFILNADLGNGQNSLHLACTISEEVFATIDLLFELIVDINCQDNQGNSPLHYVLENGHEELVDLFLINGAQLDLVNNAGVSVIEALINNPNVNQEIFKKVLPLNLQLKDGQNILHLAAKFNHIELIKTCISAGQDKNFKDALGKTPLSLALYYDKKEASDLLISLGSEISLYDSVCLGDLDKATKEITSNPAVLNKADRWGNTLLNYSIMKGQLNIFEYLVANKAALDIKNNVGLDVISLAIMHNQPPIIARLTSMGIEIKEKFGDQQFALKFMVKNGMEEMLKHYVAKGFSLKIATPEEPNLLFVAVANNQENIALYLIENGININELNQKKESCIQVALKNKNKNIFNLLRKNGGKIELKDAIQLDDMTILKKSFQEFKDTGNSLYREWLLHFAIECENLEAARLLIENGADVNEKNVKDITPLHLSLMLKNEKMAELLIKNGANIFYGHNSYQKENWQLASENGFRNILMLIIKSGFELNSQKGNILLEDFVEQGYHEVVELFIIEEKFIYSEKIQNQLTEIAKQNKDEKMIKILKSKPPTLQGESEFSNNTIYETKPGNKSIKHGKFKIFNEDGELTMSGNYQDNLLEGPVFELIPKQYFWSNYSIANYSQGILDGLKSTYYNVKNREAKLLLSQEYYKNGKLNGVCSYFTILRNKVMEITFENGVKNGQFKEWTEENVLISELEFKNDKIWSGFTILKENVDIKNISFSFDNYRSDLASIRKAFKWEFEKGIFTKKETILLPKTNSNVVNSGLDWLFYSQEEAGYWDPDKFEGKTTVQSKLQCSAISLLAFLGAGHTDRAGKYKKKVKQAVTWLLSAQLENGSFTNDNITNGLCTQAIAEAAGMGCGGSEVKLGAEKACKFLLSQQNASGGFNDFGRSKNMEPGEYDKMPATTFCIIGLKSSVLAGIYEAEIKKCFEKTDALFNKLPTTGDIAENSMGHAWFHGGGDTKESSKGGTHQGMALLVRQYLGHVRTEPWLKAAAKELSLSFPKDHQSINYFQCYFQYLTLFQQGGEVWENWHKKFSDLLFQAQSDEEKFFCSWPKMDSGPFADGGRITSSALAILSLEIYYRYKSVMK